MQTVKINRVITSAQASPTHDPVALCIREFRARSKQCIDLLHRTAICSIHQWIDSSIAVASAPAHLLYQGIPASVVQGCLEGDLVQTLHRTAEPSLKTVFLSSSDCLTVEAFLVALNMHTIYSHDERKFSDDDIIAERGSIWKVPRSTSKAATIACVCNWFKSSRQAILLCFDCFEKISTSVFADIVAILWTVRHELPVVMLLMSQCDSETVRQALSFSKSRFLRINHIFRLPSPSEQIECLFSSVLVADNPIPVLLDPQSIVVLRNRFHQTDRAVGSFVDGICLAILLHSYHSPCASTFFEFCAIKAFCSSADDQVNLGIRELYSRMICHDFLAEINKLCSVSSSKIDISAHNICHLFGFLCVRRTAYYAVPLLFRALLASCPIRLSDMWGDTLVSTSSSPVWDGVHLGDGCESTAVEKTSVVDRVRFILWTCTPAVARNLLEEFGLALSRAVTAIQAEKQFTQNFIQMLSSSENYKDHKSCDHFVADAPVLLEALQLAQSSIASLNCCGEDNNWEAPFLSKYSDYYEPSSARVVHKRRKVLGTATLQAACGSNRVKFRSKILQLCNVCISTFRLTTFADVQSGRQSQKRSI
jgi:hypothetical protein